MNFTIYKPNSKSTGSAFSFQLTKDNKNKAILYVSMIQQYSWNDKSKNGSFKENAKNSEKSATMKLSANEAGEILSSFKTRIPFLAFHRKDSDTTIIKFTPWDKKRKIKDQDGDTFYDTPAFGINVTRNSAQTFRLPLEAGETEVLSELFKEYIRRSLEVVENNSYSPKKETQKIEQEQEDDVPF